MNLAQTLPLSIVLLTTLAGCWEGDPEMEVSAPRSYFSVTKTVPEFAACDFQDREALAQAEKAFVLPSMECENGQCVVSGRGYPDGNGPFYIAEIDTSGECALREIDGVEFKESYSVEVWMNGDFLRSLGLSRSEVEGLKHHNFAGSRNGQLRGTWIDELNHDVTVTIFYDDLPADDEFIVSAQRVTFELPEVAASSEN